ncbi:MULTISPECIES: phage tail protein [Azospirillaceae]|uniref:phage tail protein n=1 Tax=Azospirillaceae TaxID=2829815 RepID=UPI000B68FB15|nr:MULTISPECIES: phage tail protein [Azospirillaceae]MDG5496976.1 phage tail protein [Niveispirillum sp. BGYR6]SNS83896.1 Phage-related protein [Azospirillum sp. RU38E]SNT01140.1 Phage-related protein [Azospirillum sp. RU37A]
MTVFAPPQPPNVGFSVENTIRLSVAQFGDGYSQRIADGINNLQQSTSLSWSALTAVEADAIEGFFKARSDGSAFTYTLPGTTGAVRWMIAQWTRTLETPGLWNINASLTKVFDL